jgi:hypothetical protein
MSVVKIEQPLALLLRTDFMLPKMTCHPNTTVI